MTDPDSSDPNPAPSPSAEQTGPGTADRKAAGAYRTISEVSQDLDLPPHVLRFWETKFTQVKPLKRGGNRRYYRPQDVELLHTIKLLLYTDGLTIKGVQKLFREKGLRQVVQDRLAPEAGLASLIGAPAATEAAETADAGHIAPAPLHHNGTGKTQGHGPAPTEASSPADAPRQPETQETPETLSDLLGELRAIHSLLSR